MTDDHSSEAERELLDDELADDAEPNEEPEPIEPPEPAGDEEPASTALSQKQIEQRMKKIDAEAERHARRVEEIMGDDFSLLIPNPVDWTPGYVFNPAVMPLPPEAVAALQELLGLAVDAELQEDDQRERCPKCLGLGNLRTGSRVPDQAVLPCSGCNGNGWKTKLHEAGTPPLPAAYALGQPTTGGNPPLTPVADRWGRPFGHPHYNLDPAQIGV